MMLELAAQRRFAVDVLSRLRSAGHTAYWAGGCVRDELLGLKPKDYDIATSARPEQVRELFGRRQTLAVGEAFGVIIVVGPKEAGSVEVATFRRDTGYSDGRRPDAVEFTDAEEDARRRDFTMNALFYDPLEDLVIDFVDGRADIEHKLVRAVGDASKRFAEDKLRMLRGVRMASSFGFTLDAATAAAIQASASQITVVSPERIAQEVRAMFGRSGQAEAARLLMATGLAAAILPEVMPLTTFTPPGLQRTAWQLSLDILARLDRLGSRSVALALAALLHHVGRPSTPVDPAAAARSADAAHAVMRRWRMSNEEREHVEWLIRRQSALDDAARRRWSEVQPVLAHRQAGDLVTFVEARAEALNVPTDHLAFARQKLALPQEELDPPPLLTGDDLIHAGLRPGKDFSRLLQAVRVAQLDGEIASKAEAVALAAKLLG